MQSSGTCRPQPTDDAAAVDLPGAVSRLGHDRSLMSAEPQYHPEGGAPVARANGTSTQRMGGTRDLRLDLFREIALFLIFADHIPGNILSQLTTQSIGFSDAAEIFIFISGYTAALVYGRIMLNKGMFIAIAKILHRVWQLMLHKSSSW
jgi:hypothetical protein